VSELIANNRDKWLMVAEEIELGEEREGKVQVISVN
jgi:hypothetical protein